MNRIEFHTKAHLYLCALIAFFLPAYIRAVPVLIALLALNWFAEGNFLEKLFALKNSKAAWLMIAFYLLHLIGMLWTEDVASGWFDLEVKLSFILLPLVLCSGKIEINKVLNGFVYGCVAASLICLSVAGIHFINTGENHFEYTLLSFLLHPSYLAMYLNLATAIVLFTFQHATAIEKAIKFLSLLLLASMTILLSSKTGTVLLGFILLAYALVQVIAYQKWKLGGLIILLFIGLLFIAVKFFPYTIDRIKDSYRTFTDTGPIDMQHLESNSIRVLVWKSDMVALKRNFALGTGTGDIKSELVKIYLESGYTLLAAKQLNAHNQFFQTAIALGITGLFILTFCFLYPGYIALKKKDILLTMFISITIVNFLVESMLEVQAGTMFFSFFYMILLNNKKDPK